MTALSPLLTDYYQLTMAYGYWQLKRAEQTAVFLLSFRTNPFHGDYAIANGLASVIEFLTHYQFGTSELNYLASLKTAQGTPVYSGEFLDYLRNLKFSCDIDAIPEGNLVFAREPLLRIQGPILQCQLLETTLINLMSFASLVATESSRVCLAANWDPVMEFGLRRSQGPDGGLTASRAAYVGGCESTSNVLAGLKFGIPVKGTQAHSWIMSYPNELQAFSDFVQVIDTTVLLVDTYQTLSGVQNAIEVGKQLRAQGRDLQAIRLDSGDLLTLSKQARALLDKAGFQQTKIVVSGDLDTKKVTTLKAQGAPIDIWGVGTRLSTAYEQPALDATYKLGAIKKANNQWDYKAKLSDQSAKSTSPGLQQVRRYYQKQKMLLDVIYDVEMGIDDTLPKGADHYADLLVPIFRQGQLVYKSPSLQETRDMCIKQVKQFVADVTPPYSVELEPKLNAVRERLLNTANKDGFPPARE